MCVLQRNVIKYDCKGKKPQKSYNKFDHDDHLMISSVALCHKRCISNYFLHMRKFLGCISTGKQYFLPNFTTYTFPPGKEASIFYDMGFNFLTDLELQIKQVSWRSHIISHGFCNNKT